MPTPTIAGFSPPSAPTAAGTLVTILGTDFTGAQQVTFGGVPAAGYTVDSETRIAAIAPAVSGPTAQAISVTTIAGTATSAAAFGRLACVVPGPSPGSKVSVKLA